MFQNVVDESFCDDLNARMNGLGQESAGSRRMLDHDWCRQLGLDVQATLANQLNALSDLRVVQCTYFHKSPTSNWLVTWHQDRSVPVASRVDSPELTGWSTKEGMTFVHGPDELLAQMVAVRLHLDDSLDANGPLRVIPGSHQTGTLSNEQIEALRQNNRDVPCLVPKGGVLAMRPLILHASSKSTSQNPRRVLHFLFGPENPRFGLAWAAIS